MFFYLSKVFWFFIAPGNAFLLVLLLGLFLRATRFTKIGKGLVSIAVVFALLLTFVPIGSSMLRSLEDRFPVPDKLPPHIDGIVVLGGIIDPLMSSLRGGLVIGGAIERVTVSAEIARNHPEARIVFTGGSGSITTPQIKEADYVSGLYESLGIPQSRIVLEREARNTWENAKYTVELVSPKPDEVWVLVTSAFHMPRAVGTFRRVGWEVIPYPVDFYAGPPESFPSPMDFSSGLSSLALAGHEWLGLITYWLTGKNSAAFPKPRGPEVR
jgi:uncharacterized SAM-binding protein YcdF (DUF218 family)